MANANGNVFDAMGGIWAEIADKNQTQRQLEFLKHNLKSNGYILDLACGTGRHSIALSSEGYCMVGLDVSGRLLRIAKQRFSDVQLVRGDLRFLPFNAGVFVAAINMDTSLGYQPSEKGDEESLDEAKRVLGSGSILIVDVFNRTHLVAKYSGKEHSSKTLEYPSFNLEQKRIVSEKGDWLCDVWSARTKADGQMRVFEHRVRLYDMATLQKLLKKSGFKVEIVFGDYEEQAFSVDQPRLIVVAVAK
jgi:ubiquinone/menaquinone biosynthesis C-methylase UbiE